MNPKDLAGAHLRFAVLAADVLIFTIKDGELLVRLIPVERPPYEHAMGLPGGLLGPEETAEQAAARQIAHKAHIDARNVYIEQLYTFSRVDRDARGRVVAVAYLALVPWTDLSEAEQQNTKEVSWQPVHKTHKLAYDHDEMLAMAVARLKSRVMYTTVIKKLMPNEFTLTELEQTYESIVKTDLDKRNFRKKILKLKILTPLSHKRGGKFRPAQLYRFTNQKVDEIEVL